MYKQLYPKLIYNSFISSATGGYALALMELIKLAFSVLNRLLARKGKVNTCTMYIHAKFV